MPFRRNLRRILPLIVLFPFLRCFAESATKDQLLNGYRLTEKEFVGPTQSLIETDPVWVGDYHTLVLSYSGTGVVNAGVGVLILRPGSIGPITPKADNPENPMASGADIIAVHGQDLVLDGVPHTLKLDLKGKLKTPQIDALRFIVPQGARLHVADLAFVADEGTLPCSTSKADTLIQSGQAIPVHGSLSCGNAAATSLRGREAITIDTGTRRGAALLLDMYLNLAGFDNFDAAHPTRPQQTNETSMVIARIHYAGSSDVVEQFPILVAQHRHLLLNRTRALYALQLEPKRRVEHVEIFDRSPHLQLVLFAAVISNQSVLPTNNALVPVSNTIKSEECTVENVLGGSDWYRVTDVAGKSSNDIHAALSKTVEGDGVNLSLTLSNRGKQAEDVLLSFPSLQLQTTRNANDSWYLFPGKVAVISAQDNALSSSYGTTFPMQFTDVFSSQGHCGAAVLVKDLRGQSKVFAMRKQGALIQDETQYRIHIEPGQSYTAPATSIVLHNGDWHSGFAAYRHWLAEWYKPQTPRPTWLSHSFYMRRDYPLGGTGLLYDESSQKYSFDMLMKEGHAFGGIDFIDISGWALSDEHGRVGDYPIELGGVGNLRENIARASSQQVPTGLYFEGHLIDKRSDIGRKESEAWQVIDKDGKGLWWPHGSPELFVCPYIPSWQKYLAEKMTTIAGETGAKAVYLDEFGCGNRNCYAEDHGHAVGANEIDGEIGMLQQVRRTLDEAGHSSTIVYTECAPVDVATPYVDGSFTYALSSSQPTAYEVKLNLWRFAFPKVKLWDMVSAGVEPHILSAEDFRLAFWQGDGVWLKGRAATWYGEDILEFLRWARPLLQEHADALTDAAEPLVESPDPDVLINRFHGTTETVYTLFNSSYQTKSVTFKTHSIVLAPRGVQLISSTL